MVLLLSIHGGNNIMDIHLLKTFVVLIDTGSFSRTGEILYLTQPAVSKRIALLENQLGVPLIDRVGKKIFITEGGRELYRRAEQLLMDIEDCKRAISHRKMTVSGVLSFSCSHHIALYRLPRILEEFCSMYPSVELDIRFSESERCRQAVESGEVEFALATLPQKTNSSLVLTPVWEDEMRIVVGTNHHLARPINKQSGSSTSTSLERIVSSRAIMPPPTSVTFQLIADYFSARGLQFQVAITSNYLETIKMLVDVGLGWGVLPSSMVDNDRIVSLGSDIFQLDRGLGVITHSKRTLSNAAAEILALIYN